MLVGGRRKVSDSSKMDVSKLDTFSCDSYLNGQESKREGADTHPWREVLSRTKREGGGEDSPAQSVCPADIQNRPCTSQKNQIYIIIMNLLEVFPTSLKFCFL